METQKGNELIAIFNGGTENSLRWFYDTSWDSLMPVIDKINGLGKEYSIAIFKTYISCTVEKGGKVYKDFSFAHSEYITSTQTSKEAAFKLVVKFIMWYNENILVKNLLVSK